jgi:hypothetical protein
MRKVISIILILTSLSCGTGRIITTETKRNETIVFGKLTIESSKALKNNKILMHFNERMWAKNAVWLDDSGYFYMKMPVGKNFIALLEYREGMGFHKNIPDNYVTINVPLTDKVYYIGDINFIWTPTDADRQKGGGAMGAIIEAKKEGKKILVTTKESETTINYFKQKFPNNTKEIITQTASVNK